MANELLIFESFVRRANKVNETSSTQNQNLHAFDERNIHPQIDSVSKKLFDDGHYSQSTFIISFTPDSFTLASN